jgi:hypothetical protein
MWHAGAFVGPRCVDGIEFDPETQAIFEPDTRPDYYHYDAPTELKLLRPADNLLKPIWQAAQKELELLQLCFKSE